MLWIMKIADITFAANPKYLTGLPDMCRCTVTRRRDAEHLA